MENGPFFVDWNSFTSWNGDIPQLRNYQRVIPNDFPSTGNHQILRQLQKLCIFRDPTPGGLPRCGNCGNLPSASKELWKSHWIPMNMGNIISLWVIFAGKKPCKNFQDVQYGLWLRIYLRFAPANPPCLPIAAFCPSLPISWLYPTDLKPTNLIHGSTITNHPQIVVYELRYKPANRMIDLEMVDSWGLFLAILLNSYPNNEFTDDTLW